MTNDTELLTEARDALHELWRSSDMRVLPRPDPQMNAVAMWNRAMETLEKLNKRLRADGAASARQQEIDALKKENERIKKAANAVIDRWNSPDWARDKVHTGELIHALKAALQGEE